MPYGRPTLASVDIVLPDGTAQRVVTDIAVRDVLIAGMGDSIAAGEGNPDRAVRLSDGGFCFRRFLGGDFERILPARARRLRRQQVLQHRAGDDSSADNWARQSARWEAAPATVRSTATRCAPRSGLRSRTPISR